ncbi:hypothetical protein ACFPAF_01780 [Hymenobacter endophyticus]|uniref:Competence protein CoiA-like N-terminal domain-containing protein n=1 Tax=Hymenobacter endophyticus TaxID=3076335 RepID=A0ABU3TCL0_9BACT|nr:hypothetical protein [Hymenobacter endophyticus]MDU0369108.1 hypothetical protein [Hymenobacter endophyticus]
MKDDTHENNVYARDLRNAIKHISEVESGRKGYYCMGCGREMQAKKGEVYAQHFAHDPKDIALKGKCTFSDETYRHGLAKDVLQMIKQIKVPALYKYVREQDGKPRKIRDSWVVSAHRVENELPFFENEDGVVMWGRNVELGEDKGRHLLIQPDVAFFDASGKPILLIEIVATHKVDREKLIKIRRLGIDTVQVSVPKDSPTEIQSTFYRTLRTKWLYNDEQEQADYLQLPEGGGKGIPPLDEFQRQLLKSVESYHCRASQIGNLLRAIGKCVDSEQYRTAYQSLVGEIQRVTLNTERARAEVRAVQARHETAIAEELRPQAERIAREAARLEEQDRELTEQRSDLEERYLRKGAELVTTQASYQPECQAEIERVTTDLAELGAGSATLEEREEEIAGEEARIREDLHNEQSAFESAARREQEEAERLEQERAGLPERYRQIEINLELTFKSDAERLQQQSEASEAGMRNDFERAGRQSTDSIKNRDSQGASSIHRRIRETLDSRRLIDSIEEEIPNLIRMRKAKDVFGSRAYKNWT